MFRKLLILLLLSSLFLEAQEFKNKAFFKKHSAIMLIIDPASGKIMQANEAAEQFYGYRIKELQAMKIQQINTFTKAQVSEEMQRAKKENRNFFIFRHRLKDRSIVRVEVYSTPVIYKNKEALFSIIHDSTHSKEESNSVQYYNESLEKMVDEKTHELINQQNEFQNLLVFGLFLQLVIILILLYTMRKQKNTEESLESTLDELTQSKQELLEIIESLPIAIARSKKEDQSIDFCNQRFTKLFGWRLSELNSVSSWFEKAYPNEYEQKTAQKLWVKLIEETNKKGLLSSETAVRVNITCKDQQRKKCQVWYHNNATHDFAIFYDMTKIEELEEENLYQQKMLLTQSKIAAVGEMLGNIAHQWRQPLSNITTRASGSQLLLDLNGEIQKEELQNTFGEILNQANYLSQTIDDFKNFFTSDNETFYEFNLKDTLDKLYGLVKDSLINNYVNVHADIDDIIIDANENSLIQSMINICNNAKDAFILNEIDTQKRHMFVTLKKENDHAILSFKDSAGGIDEKILDRIFEPYFTTKHQSMGTGVGLYMTYQMITKHFKGSLKANNVSYEFEGEPYKGAEFTLTLPLQAKN